MLNEQGGVNVTRGMFNHHNRTHGENAWHICAKCDLVIPRYPGRYPKRCPCCGCDMSHQPGYPSKYLKPPEPEPPITDETESYVPMGERLALKEWADRHCEAIHEMGGWPEVPWSPSGRVLHCERVDPLCATLQVYSPMMETAGRIVQTLVVPTWNLGKWHGWYVAKILEAIRNSSSPQLPTSQLSGTPSLPVEMAGAEGGIGGAVNTSPMPNHAPLSGTFDTNTLGEMDSVDYSPTTVPAARMETPDEDQLDAPGTKAPATVINRKGKMVLLGGEDECLL